MKTVAVTGGIGSGKSSVCRILSSRGIPVYDCDSAAKRLYDTDPALLDTLQEIFGCSLTLADGSFDRSLLARIVFSSPERLRSLESVVHPAVHRDFLGWKQRMEERFAGCAPSESFFGKSPFVVMESAIILSKPQFLDLADLVVMVDADEEVRISRVCQRDSTDRERVRQRMAVQSYDPSLVDIVIANNGTAEALAESVNEAFSSLPL